MKVAFTTLFVVGATLTNAIAVADPVADPRFRGGKMGFCGPAGVSCARDVATCGIPGSPCARMKRSAEAVASAFANAESGKRGLCGADGAACNKARRSILEVGSAVEEAVTSIYAREADPKRFRGGKMGFCGPAGVSCAKGKRDAFADADPEARFRGGKMGFCGPAGVSCARRVRRDADAAPNAEARFRGGKMGFCGPAGVSCAKGKRDADAEAEPRFRGGKMGFCGPAGVSCAKAKRDAEAISHSEEELNVARGIDSVDPEFFKMVRDADNGEGTALRAAQAAFLQVKRDAEALAEDATPYELLAYCDEYDCDEETVATIVARVAGTFDEREAEACNAPGGGCEIAKRQLGEIEAKLQAAVEAL